MMLCSTRPGPGGGGGGGGGGGRPQRRMGGFRGGPGKAEIMLD